MTGRRLTMCVVLTQETSLREQFADCLCFTVKEYFQWRSEVQAETPSFVIIDGFPDVFAGAFDDVFAILLSSTAYSWSQCRAVGIRMQINRNDPDSMLMLKGIVDRWEFGGS